jgi:hypothetical protein
MASSRSSRRTLRIALLLVVATLMWPPSPVVAQSRRSRLVVTVADQSGAVIPNARVTVTGQDAATQATPRARVMTNGIGQGIFESVVEGRYTIEAEFDGFDTAVVRDVRVRGEETRRRLTLQIKKLDEEVTVSRDRRSSALDPQGSAFSTVLTREQIAALPDDPDEMEAVLKAMAPPGATFRVDGFTGGKLPPKSMIRSIRLPKMDMFAAQNHGGMSGMIFIDIMTMPGMGPLGGNVDFNFMDGALNARNAFTPVKGQEQLRQLNYALSGTIKQNKASFSLTGGVGSQYSSPNLFAKLPDGTTADQTIRQPRDSFSLTARLDYAINKDHAMRVSFDRSTATSRALGVSGYDLMDRAYESSSTTHMMRVSENGPIGRRLFTESRLQVRWLDSSSQSAVDLPTTRVVDAFTSGGAQRRGGQKQLDIELASDLDYVRGAHSYRTGFQLEGSRLQSDDMSNYLGTFTFASLAAYAAGRPLNYTRRVGNPDLTYSTLQAGVYVQDDYRVARSVLLSAGVRYGIQTHVNSRWNLSPRITAAWSPRKNGSLTIRGAYGYFYDWIPGDLYKQTLLVDGVRLRELNVVNPSYPDPGAGGAATPTNRYLWSEDLALPNAHRVNVGVDQAISKNGRVTLTYSLGWGRGLLRGRNLNTPFNGVRPDGAFANVIELTTDAASRSSALNVSYNLMRMDWHRTFLMVNYTWSSARSNTAGAFSIPASGDNLATEWGPSAGDVRHRVGASISTSPLQNLSMSLNARGSSGMPYNITTGHDDNTDGVLNDRPAGIGRNAARGASQWDLGGRVSYAVGFGTPKRAAGGGGGTRVVVNLGGGGGLAPGFGGGAADKRFRVEFYIAAQNLLNRVNYTGYSFVLTAPFYGRPVAASQPRKLQMGIRFAF